MAEKKGQSLEEQSLEEIFSDLEQTIKKMEEGEISLEESFQLYHQGMDMLKACNSKIDKVEKKMLLLDEEGEEHEFQRRIYNTDENESGRDRRNPETISSGGRRISEGDHGGNGVQSDGRREKTPTDADAGDLQTFWRRTGDIKAFYGST